MQLRRTLPGLVLGPALALAPLCDALAGDGQKVAVLPVAVEGEMATHAVADLEARILEELSHGDAEVIGPGGLPDGSAECHEAKCATEIGGSVDATYVVRTIVTVEDPDHRVELLVLSARTGDIVASTGDTCDTCGMEEVAQVAVDLATAVRRKLDAQASEPPKLIVNSAPAGAIVTLDGETLGTTPLEVVVPTGEHDLVVSKDGFVNMRQRLMFVDGVRESFSATLAPVPTAETKDEPAAGGGLRGAGFGLIALGLAGVGTGIGFFVTDEKEITSDCSGAQVDADGDCQFRWDTTPGAIAFTAVGGAAVITGAILVGLGYKKRNAAKTARLSPTVDGFVLRF